MVKVHLLKELVKKKNIHLDLTSSKNDFEFFQMYHNNKKIWVQMPLMKLCELYENVALCEFHDIELYKQLLNKVQKHLNTKYENKFAMYGNKVKIKIKNTKIFNQSKTKSSESLEPNDNIKCILFICCIWKNTHEKTWDISLQAEQVMKIDQHCLFTTSIESSFI